MKENIYNFYLYIFWKRWCILIFCCIHYGYSWINCCINCEKILYWTKKRYKT